ncbi:class I SAM-dependent methyltransferase [Roseinatronobacter alkalisoli]|uniref:Class I SAM-dependent methyltransferase n=1 Tax=Roseinatronobacter alkalisoli TaxID=3028235 RepID=A0ABT5T7L9_9RHOB|nr:class I SAM-dependent methyltransferase [Roseinatronobacter sp. HJB301]MDD7969948.1 class I SAM-dependent methyltransferase [Roseinatronobacter sp. HJB301]
MTATEDARFWDKASRRYAKAKISDLEGYERSLERTRALLGPDDRVLELGCGTGTTALRLAPHVQSYLATDISGKMIAIAVGKAATHPAAALTFRTATAESLASGETRYDAILGFNYLHLVREPETTLRNIHGMLRPGGLFISKTPCLADMNFLLRNVLLPCMRAVGLAPYVAVMNADTLIRLVDATGFEILAKESHAAKGKDARPFIVTRKT